MNHTHPPLGRRIKLLQRVKISSLLRDLVLTFYRIELNNALKTCCKLEKSSFARVASENKCSQHKDKSDIKRTIEKSVEGPALSLINSQTFKESRMSANQT